MPLTSFQKEIAHFLAKHRNPESHVAGGSAINRTDASFRYSEDLDIFHDLAESVATSAELDAKALLEAGYAVDWLLRQIGFYRADVSRGPDRVRLDWTTDSSFRFFPVQPDEDFGYCLHPADLTVNKLLAFVGRSEIRDYLDVLFLDETYLSLGAAMWAACGKDPGYTPALLLDQANRHSCFQNADLKGENLARPVDLKILKKQWLAARERSEKLFVALPEEDIGCLYLNSDGKPISPDPDNLQLSGYKRHFGSVRGAWPTFS